MSEEVLLQIVLSVLLVHRLVLLSERPLSRSSDSSSWEDPEVRHLVEFDYRTALLEEAQVRVQVVLQDPEVVLLEGNRFDEEMLGGDLLPCLDLVPVILEES